jgi:hypothetical protein
MALHGRQRWRAWRSKAEWPDTGGEAAGHGRHRQPDTGGEARATGAVGEREGSYTREMGRREEASFVGRAGAAAQNR